MFHRTLQVLTLCALAAPATIWAQSNNDAGRPRPKTTASYVVSNPCTTITGTMGSNSAGYPGTSGIQPARIYRDGLSWTCGLTKGWPGSYSDTFPYDAYTFTNGTGSSQCVTFTLANPGSTFMHLIIYTTSYNPANIATNYFSDCGGSTAGGQGYPSSSVGVTVAAGQTIVAVVQGLDMAASGLAYTLAYDNICVAYDRSYLDNNGNAMICYNSATGDYRWSILKGYGAGQTFADKAVVSNGGNSLMSAPGNPKVLSFNYLPYLHSAAGSFVNNAYPGFAYSVLSDSNTLNNPPSPCVAVSGKVQ